MSADETDAEFNARCHDTIQQALVKAVGLGADEHLWVCSYLKTIVHASQDWLDSPAEVRDTYLAEIVRGLVAGLDELDAATEARLADAFGGSVVDA